MGLAVGLVAVATLACRGSQGTSAGTSASASASPSASVASTLATAQQSASAAPTEPTPCPEATKLALGTYAAEAAFDRHSDAKTKHRVSYQCGTNHIAAFYFDDASETEALAEAEGIGSALWAEARSLEGGLADEVLLRGTQVLLLSGDGLAPVLRRLRERQWAQWRPRPRGIEAELARVLDCGPTSADALRAWCPVATSASAPYAPPAARATYLGITATLPPGSDARALLVKDLSPAALSLDGQRVALTRLFPRKALDKSQLAAAANAVARVLRGEATAPITVPKSLAAILDAHASELATTGASASAPTKSGPSAFADEDPAVIALVHGSVDAYVVIARARDGAAVSVFPTSAYAPE